MLVFTFLLGVIALVSFVIAAMLNINTVLFSPLEQETFDTHRLEHYSKLFIKSGSEKLSSRFYNFDGKDVFLYFHGNAGNVSYYQHVPLVCSLLGVDVFMIDYRGFGASSGQTTISSVLEDGLAAYDFLSQWYPAKNIRIWGDSFGTTVASYVAAKRKCERLLLVGAFSCLEDLMVSRQELGLMPTFEWITNAFIAFMNTLRIETPTFEWFSKVDCPSLLVHGKDDNVVPLSSSDRLLEVNNRAKRMVTEGGHLTFDLSREQLRELVHFLKGKSVSESTLDILQERMERYKSENPLLNRPGKE